MKVQFGWAGHSHRQVLLAAPRQIHVTHHIAFLCNILPYGSSEYFDVICKTFFQEFLFLCVENNISKERREEVYPPHIQ